MDSIPLTSCCQRKRVRVKKKDDNVVFLPFSGNKECPNCKLLMWRWEIDKKFDNSLLLKAPIYSTWMLTVQIGSPRYLRNFDAWNCDLRESFRYAEIDMTCYRSIEHKNCYVHAHYAVWLMERTLMLQTKEIFSKCAEKHFPDKKGLNQVYATHKNSQEDLLDYVTKRNHPDPFQHHINPKWYKPQQAFRHNSTYFAQKVITHAYLHPDMPPIRITDPFTWHLERQKGSKEPL